MKERFSPKKENYEQKTELRDDLMILTGTLDKNAIESILKGVSLILCHYLAEKAKDGNIESSFTFEVPYIGSITVSYDKSKTIPNKLTPEIKLSKYFYDNVLKSFEGESPLEKEVAKNFTELFIDRYKSLI